MKSFFYWRIPLKSPIPIPEYLIIFQSIPAYSALFLRVPFHQGIFQSFPVSSSVFQPIPTYSSLTSSNPKAKSADFHIPEHGVQTINNTPNIETSRFLQSIASLGRILNQEFGNNITAVLLPRPIVYQTPFLEICK